MRKVYGPRVNYGDDFCICENHCVSDETYYHQRSVEEWMECVWLHKNKYQEKVQTICSTSDLCSVYLVLLIPGLLLALIIFFVVFTVPPTKPRLKTIGQRIFLPIIISLILCLPLPCFFVHVHFTGRLIHPTPSFKNRIRKQLQQLVRERNNILTLLALSSACPKKLVSYR